MLEDIDKYTQNIQQQKYITKNITSVNDKISHIILQTKSYECPW